MCIHTAVYSSDQQLFIDLRYILLELFLTIINLYRLYIQKMNRYM